MVEAVPVVLGYLIGMIALLIVASRGFYFFYSKLRLYHKLPQDYDPIIELRNADEVADPGQFVYRHDLDLDTPDDGTYYCTSDEVDKHNLDPQVVVDFDSGTKIYRGERKWLKYASVWFYSGVVALVTTILIIGYMQILVDFFSLEDIPALEVVISILVMVSSIHLSLRLSSFLNLGILDWQKDRDFNEGLYNFAFSFNMSILTLWTVTFFSFMILQDASQDPVLGTREIITVIGAAIIVSGVLSLIGETLIRRGDLSDELMETKVRATKEIELSEE
jgi:hypothetical protein